MAEYFALFETAIGRSAIAWGERGLLSLLLPEISEQATRARLTRRLPLASESAPPDDIRRTIDAISALLHGERVDLTSVALDLSGIPAFDQRVYEIARTIPAGQTLSYGDVARRLGDPIHARAVGQALGRNRFPIVVPCHRVLAADGGLGGFSAHGGAETKRRMLIIEGAVLALDL